MNTKYFRMHHKCLCFDVITHELYSWHAIFSRFFYTRHPSTTVFSFTTYNCQREVAKRLFMRNNYVSRSTHKQYINFIYALIYWSIAVIVFSRLFLFMTFDRNVPYLAERNGPIIVHKTNTPTHTWNCTIKFV